MTKISQLSSIGDSLAVNDQFLIRDVDDATTPNKSVTVSGITRALDVGNATAPAIAFASDKNTGIYSPGADQVAISTNGTQRLLIKDASQDTLRVSGVNAVVTADAIGSSYPGFRLASNGSILAGFDGDSGNSASLFTYGAQPLIFGTDSAERLRITSAGLVGVGTSSPSATLEVNGTLTTQGNILASSGGATRTITLGNAGAGLEYNVDGTTYLGGRTDGFPLVFRTSNTERLRITSAGLVGIGTAIPSVRLQIQDSIAGGSGGTIATLHNFSDTGGDTRYTGLNFVIGSDNGTSAIRAARTLSAVDYRTDLSFWTNPTGATQTPVRAMTIDYLQRVGIGSVTPQSPLVVSDGGAAGIEIRPALSDIISFNRVAGTWGDLILNSANNVFQIQGGEVGRFDNSGRLLVGTSSVSVASTAVFQGNSASSTDNPLLRLNRGEATPANGAGLGYIIFGDSAGSDGAYVFAQRDGGTWSGSSKPTRLVFSTTADGASSPTERMRITSTGRMILTDTDTAASAATARIFKNAASTQSIPALLLDKYDNTSTTSQVFVQFTIDNQGTASGQINANGASQAAFGSWSDARLKDNIVDLPSQWLAIKTLRPVEFDYIESEGGGHQIGFIAQEVQEIYPDVVGERGDGMLTLSGMGKNESRLIKALQEAMERIEQLEQRLTDAGIA